MATTHIKKEFYRRSGAPSSDMTTLVEHFIRHGNVGAGAVQHVDVTLNVVAADGVLRERRRSGEPRHDRQRSNPPEAPHRFISRSTVGMYSGYVVGAPPNTASNGNP